MHVCINVCVYHGRMHTGPLSIHSIWGVVVVEQKWVSIPSSIRDQQGGLLITRVVCSNVIFVTFGFEVTPCLIAMPHSLPATLPPPKPDCVQRPVLLTQKPGKTLLARTVVTPIYRPNVLIVNVLILSLKQIWQA